jgi:hypothetical protein
MSVNEKFVANYCRVKKILLSMSIICFSNYLAFSPKVAAQSCTPGQKYYHPFYSNFVWVRKGNTNLRVEKRGENIYIWNRENNTNAGPFSYPGKIYSGLSAEVRIRNSYNFLKREWEYEYLPHLFACRDQGWTINNAEGRE